MDRDQYATDLKMCWLIAMSAESVDTTKMLDAMREAETTAPMLDPTAWIAKGRAFGEDKRIVEAVHNLATALRAIKAQHGEKFDVAARTVSK